MGLFSKKPKTPAGDNFHPGATLAQGGCPLGFGNVAEPLAATTPGAVAAASTAASNAASTDYERYMGTSALLQLQKAEDVLVHHDELMFQVVHQSFELWCKLILFELRSVGKLLDEDRLVEAYPLIERCTDVIKLQTDAIHVLERMTPMDFHVIRVALGQGSGAESPGFRQILADAPKLWPHVAPPNIRVGDWQVEGLLEMLLKYHPTIFMHKSVPIPPEWREPVERFAKRLGYRFALHQMILPLSARAGERVATTVTIDNRGVAPIYRPYTFALRFSQGRGHHVVPLSPDIRTWMPDYSSFRETFTIPRGLRKGEAAVSCGIIRDGKSNGPAGPVVRLAIQAVDKDGWHPLTKIDVAS